MITFLAAMTRFHKDHGKDKQFVDITFRMADDILRVMALEKHIDIDLGRLVYNGYPSNISGDICHFLGMISNQIKKEEGSMLSLCDDGHVEIAHEGSKCQICKLLAEKDAEIRDLDNEVGELTDRVESMRHTIIELEKGEDN